MAITGANGKTCTKDLAAAVLARRFRTHASPASFNNEIGLPMTLLGAEPGTEVVVAELGARHVGDVALLRDIARPTSRSSRTWASPTWRSSVPGRRSSRRPPSPSTRLGVDGVAALLHADDPVVAGYAMRGRMPASSRSAWVAGADVRAESVAVGDEGRAAFTLAIGDDRVPTCELARAR